MCKIRGGSVARECVRNCKDPKCSLHPERDRKMLYRKRKKEEISKSSSYEDGWKKRKRESLEEVKKLKK